MSNMTLWGFDGSTYVRTVKMLLEEKAFTDFKQVPLNVLKGEPKLPEHLQRHPFGKVPVLDHDGMRILETSAITRYLNDVLPGKSLIPGTPKDRARMDMVIGIIDSYGYGALLGGVCAYHLFPDFVGRQERRRADRRPRKGSHDPRFCDGDEGRLAVHCRRPQPRGLCIWRRLRFTCHSRRTRMRCSPVPGFSDWWTRIQALQSYQNTLPNLG